MKRIFLSLIALCSLAAVAQNLHENESALIYYMPYTSVYLEIEYDEIIATAGPFYQYSERYLGTKDVVMENNTTFAIKNIAIRTKTKADKTREYKVVNTKNVNAALLSINSKGILTGYNCQPESESKNSMPIKHKEVKEQQISNVMPLMEEYLLTGSISKQAEGAAKQIYRIREDRMDILSGNTEHAPADGKAMEKVLNELDKLESALTALFIGNTTIKHHKKSILLPLEDMEEAIAFRFSKYLGVVDADDLSGAPVYMDMNIIKQTYKPYGEKEKAVKTISTGIYCNIPGEANIHIYSDILSREYKFNKYIGQFGISVPLTPDMLNDTHIIFNQNTGNIVSISK